MGFEEGKEGFEAHLVRLLKNSFVSVLKGVSNHNIVDFLLCVECDVLQCKWIRRSITYLKIHQQ